MINMNLTIIVPTYNSIAKMSATLDSLKYVTDRYGVRVLFIDDCSQDSTYDDLVRLAGSISLWEAYRLPSNSGSAAAPRNFGIEHAKTDYIFFLDSDDVLIPSGILSAWTLAKNGYDIVRSAILVRYGNGREVHLDRIRGWANLDSTSAKLKAVVKNQGLTCSCMIRRELLMEEGIRFNPERRIGEDIVFTSRVLSVSRKISYRDAPSVLYIRNASGEESVTHKINSRQFEDFIISWEEVQGILRRRNVDFIHEHGFAAISYALRQLLWFHSEELDETAFERFHGFCNEYRSTIAQFPFPERFAELLSSVYLNDRASFNRQLRLRMLVVGHDLKFMSAILPYLRTEFDVEIDEWTSLDDHDEAQSRACLARADLVWVEWLLGAAVWYSRNIRSDQRLVVRAHRTEMGVEYGLRVDWDRVSALVTIAPHTFGDFVDRFDIPREKVYLVPNVWDIDQYRHFDSEERMHRVGIVGILPMLKRFDLAIELLARLRERDPKMKLWVYGKRPEDLAWVYKDEVQRDFYDRCSKMIADLGLEDAVEYKGWVDVKKDLCEVAAVVSMSDFEGMQVAIGDAFCAGSVGAMLHWRGAEACYPGEFIFGDVESMASWLLELLGNVESFHAAAERGLEYMRTNFDPTETFDQLNTIFKSVRA